MKTIVRNIEESPKVKMSDVDPYAIVGGINIGNGRKCIVHRDKKGYYSTIAIDPSHTMRSGCWDDRIHESIHDMFKTLDCPTTQWFLFDTQRELLEWLLK